MDKDTSKATHENKISVEEVQATLAKTLKRLAEEIQDKTARLQALQQEVESNTQEFQRLFRSFLSLMGQEGVPSNVLTQRTPVEDILKQQQKVLQKAMGLPTGSDPQSS
jgi:predicted nuclease with TOPRIM domain